MRRLACVVLLSIGTACAPKAPVKPVTVTSGPAFPDFVEPILPPALTGDRAALNYHRGWQFLQAGDLRSAEREFSSALKATAAFYPAETGLGYVELARKSGVPALGHFDKALERQRYDLSALVGQGLALVALNRGQDALSAFESALKIDPSVGDVARRVEVLRFQVQQEELDRAREASRAGRLDDAAASYSRMIASSPDSAVLYRELAAVERQQDKNDLAMEHLRKASALDPSDARSLVQVAEIFERADDLDAAAKTLADAIAVEPNTELEEKLRDLRQRAEIARLPAEYRAIESAAEITRGDLAALVGVRVLPLLPPERRQDTVLITDIRNHWAATWIVAVARAGVMQPFANHTFQPQGVVRRTEMAQVVSRLLARLPPAAGQSSSWRSARGQFADLAPGHVAYPAVSAAVASGVMTVDENKDFFPARPVTGAEAAEMIGRLEAMVRVPTTGNSSSK